MSSGSAQTVRRWRHRIRKKASHARKSPAARRAKHVTVQAVSNSQVARRVASFAIRIAPRQLEDLQRTWDPFPTPGRLIAGQGHERLPVVIINLIGEDVPTITQLVDEIAALQLATAGFRPVFVLDQPALAITRRYGFATELVMEPAAWPFDQRWDDYVARRLRDILSTYGAKVMINPSAEGLSRRDLLALGVGG